MKSKIALMVENKRLKDRVSELENRIEKINKKYNTELYSLHAELTTLLGVLRNET